jgi:hypothetical protein
MDMSLMLGIAGLPTPMAALITIGVPLALALTMGAVIFSLFTPQEFAQNAFVGSVKYTFVVQIYAVVAALTLVGSWDIYQTFRDTLQREVAILYVLAHAAEAYNLPEQEGWRQEMRDAIRAYAAAVVTRDWPLMQAGLPSSASDAEYTRIARAFFEAPIHADNQQAVAENAAGWIHFLAEARIARLSVMSRTLSSVIWFLVLTVSVAAIAFQWFFGSANQAMHYAMGAVIAIIVGGVLLVALKLAFPLVGDAALLTPRPFLTLMELS